MLPTESMFPTQLSDPRAFEIAQALLDGFNRHYKIFRATSARAKGRFENADWHDQQRAQRERIEFYDLRVEETYTRLEQSLNVCQTTVVQDAWARGQEVVVHGWVYGLHNGLIQDMRMSVAHPQDLLASYEKALTELKQRYA